MWVKQITQQAECTKHKHVFVLTNNFVENLMSP